MFLNDKPWPRPVGADLQYKKPS